MTTDRMALELLRWELERVFTTRDAVFQRAAILIGIVSVAGALLANVVTADSDTSPKFTRLTFWVFTAGLLFVVYAGYLAVRVLMGGRTMLREVLGGRVFENVLREEDSAQAQKEILQRLLRVLRHNQLDLVERRRRLNWGLAFMGVGVLLIGVALWYAAYRSLG